MTKRKEVFKSLEKGIFLRDKKCSIQWCESLDGLKEVALTYHQDDDYTFVNFGNSLIFDDLEIKLSTTKLTKSGLKFTEIGGALDNNEEAKTLFVRLVETLGPPDYFSESYGETYTYWEDEYSKIEIYPRHHMGGEWFEYRIMTKKCE